jgi:hypothetical protein
MKQKGFYVESRICNELDNTSGKVKRALLLVQQEEDKQGENGFPVGAPIRKRYLSKPNLVISTNTLIQIMKVPLQDPLVVPDPKFHNSFTPFPRDAMSLPNVLTKVVS